MLKNIGYATLIILGLTLLVWAVSSFVQPVLPGLINGSLVLLFVVLAAVVNFLANMKDILELFQNLGNSFKKNHPDGSQQNTTASDQELETEMPVNIQVKKADTGVEGIPGEHGSQPFQNDHPPLRDDFYKGGKFLKADFSGKNLKGADFSGADLSRANFQKADLSSARFVGATLVEVDLRYAVLIDADFTEANCRFMRISSPQQIVSKTHGWEKAIWDKKTWEALQKANRTAI